MPELKINPSLLSADFARLKDEIQRMEAAGADMLHLDVMDGHFVPNLTIGPPVVECVRKVTTLPLDCHLMVNEPEKYVGRFCEAGADIVTFHAEAVAMEYARKWKELAGAGLLASGGYTMTMPCKQLYDMKRFDAAVGAVRSKGKRVGVAINPDTEAENLFDILDRVDMVLAMTVWPGFGGQKFIEPVMRKVEKLRAKAPELDIEVDGGLDPQTVKAAGKAGANIIVAGTATFRAPDAAAVIRALRENALAARVK